MADTRTRGPASAAASAAAYRLRIDRIRCTGHGVCAQLLEGKVGLDEWGYPIVADDRLDATEAERVVTLCPAMAVWLDPLR